MKKDLEKEKRELFNLVQKGKVFDLFNTIIQNLIQEIEILSDSIDGDDTDEILDQMYKRSDSYSELVYNLLLDGIFLSVGKQELMLVYESLSTIIDKLQHLGLRKSLQNLPDWVIDHLKIMLNLLISILNEVSQLFEDNSEIIPKLTGLTEIEQDADISHHMFLDKLYKSDLDHKTFRLSEMLDQLIEDCIDSTEQLGKRLYVTIYQYRISTKKPPKYLS
jgi:uncharacterized protein Yka (UPF0111/DUF47 family)